MFNLVIAGIIALSQIPFNNIVMDSHINTTGYIFLGDSRTVGLNNACDIQDIENVWVVAKVGEGYRWLKNTAENEIESIVDSNKYITDWVLVSNLGVNDLDNIGNYKSWYTDILDDFDLKIVSVNPVDGEYSYMSKDIMSFNNSIEKFCSLNGVDYIDSYSNLDFSTVDGLHYTKSTYSDIEDYIFEMIGLDFE